MNQKEEVYLKLENLELKLIALKEGFRNKFAGMVDEYEDKIADIRVELTNQASVIDQLNDHNRALEEENERLKKSLEEANTVTTEIDVIEGEIVEEEEVSDDGTD